MEPVAGIYHVVGGLTGAVTHKVAGNRVRTTGATTALEELGSSANPLWSGSTVAAVLEFALCVTAVANEVVAVITLFSTFKCSVSTCWHSTSRVSGCTSGGHSAPAIRAFMLGAITRTPVANCTVCTDTRVQVIR